MMKKKYVFLGQTKLIKCFPSGVNFEIGQVGSFLFRNFTVRPKYRQINCFESQRGIVHIERCTQSDDNILLVKRTETPTLIINNYINVKYLRYWCVDIYGNHKLGS